MVHLIDMESYLGEENYEGLVKYYEELIEIQPEEKINYLYLVVSYLLAEKEEEAQAAWFYLIAEGNENQVDNWSSQLAEIIVNTAEYLEKSQKFYRVWLLRRYLQTIIPDSVNNILKLIVIETTLGIFNLENLEKWNFKELLANNYLSEDDYSFFIDVITNIGLISSEQIFDFINVLIEGEKIPHEQKQLFANILSGKLTQINYHISYDLAKICLRINPDNLYCLLYLTTHNSSHQEAKEFAQILLQKANSLGLKTFAKYLFVLKLLETHQWDNLNSETEDYKLLLNECIKEQIGPKFIEDNVILVMNVLPYLQDKPRENNYLKYSIGKLFQQEQRAQITDNKYSEHSDKKTNTFSQKIKVGYIASTLRRHSVGWLARWLFVHHNKDEFELYLYLVNSQEDDLTQIWISPYVDKIYQCQQKEKIKANQIAAEQISNDQIHILVDLDSYTNNFTCQILALKPAPIQVTWLGSDTSGLPSIDYFIADNYVLPENAQEYYQTKIWRLPNTYLAVNGFEINIKNIKKEDFNIPQNSIIYLNVQNAKKLNPLILSLQMRIIKAVNNSYLFVKNMGDQTGIKELYSTIAEQENLDFSRIIFLQRDNTEEDHRANLQIADIILDTYPYNGSTTTLEALWLEIPVVTKVGQQFAARNSYTYMINAGITEGIAWSDEEYIEWGIKLGIDENLRKEVSWKLRQSKKTSPLWNAKQFTREMEKAYQQMWEIYVN